MGVMNKTVGLIVTGPVATIEMRDPQTRNAFTPQWLRDFSEAIETVANNTSIDQLFEAQAQGKCPNGEYNRSAVERFFSTKRS